MKNLINTIVTILRLFPAPTNKILSKTRGDKGGGRGVNPPLEENIFEPPPP